MKWDEVLRGSRRAVPRQAAVERWRVAAFAPERVEMPIWVPSLASGLATAAMLLLLWPAAARGPLALRAAGEACDGRWEQAVPLRADVGALARPQPVIWKALGGGKCGLCHLPNMP